jgi:hypothetical protein
VHDVADVDAETAGTTIAGPHRVATSVASAVSEADRANGVGRDAVSDKRATSWA